MRRKRVIGSLEFVQLEGRCFGRVAGVLLDHCDELEVWVPWERRWLRCELELWDDQAPEFVVLDAEGRLDAVLSLPERVVCRVAA